MNHHPPRYHNSYEASAASSLANTAPSSSQSPESIAAEQPNSSEDILGDSYMPLSTPGSSNRKTSRCFCTQPQHQQYPTPDRLEAESQEQQHHSLPTIPSSIIPPPSFVMVDESSRRSIKRRGAAGYSELLKSAFEASMKFDIDFDDDDDQDEGADNNYRIQRRRQEDDDYSSIRSDCTSQEDYFERKRRRSLSSIESGTSSCGFPATAAHTPMNSNYGNKRRRTSVFLGSMFQGMELQTITSTSNSVGNVITKNGCEPT